MGQKRAHPRSRPNGARTDEEASCLGKDRYPSESGAREALRLFRKTGTLRSCDGLEVYQCRFCPGWHFGH